MDIILTLNLRRYLVKRPSWKRADASVKILKEILRKKIKVNHVKIGKGLNEALWKNGIKNPPTKIRIKIDKSDKFATAEIIS